MELEAAARRAVRQSHRDPEIGPDEPLVLDALEADQLVSAKHPYGRRRLGKLTSTLMWGLRLYVLLALVVVADRIVQVLRGG